MSLGDFPHDISDTKPLPEWMQSLRETDRALPEALQDQILASGRASLFGLVQVLEDTLADDETDHGRAPMHAAKLLGMLGDAQAVPVLLRMLRGFTDQKNGIFG